MWTNTCRFISLISMIFKSKSIIKSNRSYILNTIGCMEQRHTTLKYINLWGLYNNKIYKIYNYKRFEPEISCYQYFQVLYEPRTLSVNIYILSKRIFPEPLLLFKGFFFYLIVNHFNYHQNYLLINIFLDTEN